MDADSFIIALRRFITFRGTPAVVYSDNGTNIKAGDKELAQGIANLNSARVYGEAADRGVDWRYSPPTGSSFGGVWERLVGSSKVALLAILEARSVNDEVLRTVFAEVMSLLNSRLTPNHFLIGGPHPHRAPDCVEAFDGLTRRSVLAIVHRRPVLATMDERVCPESHRAQTMGQNYPALAGW